MSDKSSTVMTLCGGSCKSCPDVDLVDGKDKTLSLTEYGQAVELNEEQLQMLVAYARAKGFDV